MPADEITCYLPDLCGCGRSRRSEDPASYRVEQQVADLAALIEQLDLYNLHLVGHSLGAAIALTYAATDPTRLRSLTLVSTPSPAGTPTPPEGYELLEQMRVDRGLLSQALASIMPARAPDAFFQQVVDDAQGQAPAAFTATAEALDQWRLPPEALAQLRLPVLLMWGDRDQIVERDVSDTASAVDPRRQQPGDFPRRRPQSDAGANRGFCGGVAGVHWTGFCGVFGGSGVGGVR